MFSPILQTHPKEDNEKDKDEVERNAKMEMSGDMHIIGKEAQFEKVEIEKNAKINLQSLQNEGIPTTTILENENEANVEGFTIEYKLNKIENLGIPVENKETYEFSRKLQSRKIKNRGNDETAAHESRDEAIKGEKVVESGANCIQIKGHKTNPNYRNENNLKRMQEKLNEANDQILSPFVFESDNEYDMCV